MAGVSLTNVGQNERSSDLANAADRLTNCWQQAIASLVSRDAKNGSPAADRHIVVLTDNGSEGASHSAGASTGPAQPPLSWDPATEDAPWTPPRPYHDEYDVLTSGMSDQADTTASLSAPLDQATLLYDNWHKWHLDSIDWAHPPSTLPPEALNALAYVESNPALLNAIKAGGDNGSIDGPITQKSLGDFASQAGADLNQASKDFQAWQKAHPNADATATELARSAAFIEANATLLSNAAGSSQPGWSGNVFNASDLSALASNNPGLSPELTGAAKLWSDPGMFRQIDQAGQSMLSDPDGLANAGNFSVWLTSAAPGDQNSTMDFFNTVASRDAVINVDTSNLTSDVFDHPEKYSGAQKAAVLQELQDTQDRMVLDNQLQITDVGTQQADGINPNLLKTNADLADRIDQLSSDPDVLTYLSTASPSALQTIVGADPSLKNAFNDGFAALQSGQTLNDDLAGKDSKGNPVSYGEALHTFAAQAGFFQLAMGQSGAPIPDLDLTAIAKKSGSYDKIAEAYQSDIVSGKRLQQLVDQGNDPINAAAQFSQEVQGFNSVIDPTVVAKNTSTLQANFQDVLTNQVFNHLTAAELNQAFGDGHGNLDEDKVKKFIAADDAANPPAPGEDTTSDTTRASDALHIIKAVWDGVRSGERISDVMNTYLGNDRSTSKWSVAYQKGGFHLAADLLGGAYLATALAGSPQRDPGQITADVGTGINLFGSLVVGAGRYIRSNDSANLADAKAAVVSAQDAKNAADAKLAKAKSDLSELTDQKPAAAAAAQFAQLSEDQAQAVLNVANADVAHAATVVAQDKAALAPALAASLADPSNDELHKALQDAIEKYGADSTDLANKQATAANAQDAFNDARHDRSVKQSRLNNISAGIRTGTADVRTAETASTKADSDLAAAKKGLDEVKNTPIEQAKQKSPAAGRAVGGVGNVVLGIGSIIYGSHLKEAGQVAFGNINIAQGAVSTTVGTLDAADGIIKFVGGPLAKVKLPQPLLDVLGLAGDLGKVAPVISTVGDVIGAVAGVALTIAGVIVELEEEKKQAVSETHATDALLKKYGITGGPTTAEDVIGAGPLGDGEIPLPGGIGTGGGPSQGPAPP